MRDREFLLRTALGVVNTILLTWEGGGVGSENHRMVCEGGKKLRVSSSASSWRARPEAMEAAHTAYFSPHLPLAERVRLRQAVVAWAERFSDRASAQFGFAALESRKATDYAPSYLYAELLPYAKRVLNSDPEDDERINHCKSLFTTEGHPLVIE